MQVNIKIDLRETWLWDDSDKVRYFLDLTYMGENNDVKCSLGQLSLRWKITKNAVRYFLMQAEKFGLLKKTPYGVHINDDVVGSFESTEHKKNIAQVKATKPKPIEEKQQDMLRRQKIFYEELVPYVERFGKKIVRDFYNYWTEPNKDKTKMRYENEKAFDINRRLNTWERNNEKYERNSQTRNERSFNDAVEQRNRIKSLEAESILSAEQRKREVESGDTILI